MLGIIAAKGQDGSQARYKCRSSMNETVTVPSGVISWRSIDIFFEKSNGPDSENAVSLPTSVDNTVLFFETATDAPLSIDPQAFGSAVGFRLLLDGLVAAEQGESVVRLIVPQTRGHIVRSDIIPLRLLDCPGVTTALGFAKPLQYFDGEYFSVETLQDIIKAFSASVGGLLLKSVGATCTDSLDSLLACLDVELRERLSFPWLSMQAPKRKTLALVEGGRRSPDRGGNGETVFKAAEALGIDMVVIDNTGHWLDGPRWAHWRKAFIPVECTEQSDSVFARRVVEAIRAWGGHLDGLVTFCDHYKVPIAEAASQLSLPTFPPETLFLATDKYRLSLAEGRDTYLASSFEQATKIIQGHSLEFPLIIKPSTMGFLSEGVYRVENFAQLEAGMRLTDTERHGLDFVIEKYCDGPEVDANFVLCDGELLFFEASDEFPKGADVNGQKGNVESFIELGNVLPSALPADELSILRDSLHQSLLRVGLRDGVYHLEARVENSRMEYAANENGLDLAKRSVPTKGKPSSWLLEINPRPPGIQAADASKHTYGIDYWGLGLLFALEDNKRIGQLSHPFSRGPQYWSQMVFVPVKKGGTYDSEDTCVELFNRRPDLAAHVSWWCCFWQKGERVPDPSEGRNTWVAHINVFSRTSRAHVLEIGDTIRKELKYSII